MSDVPCPASCPLARRQVLGRIAAVVAIAWVDASRSATPEDVRLAEFGVPIEIGDIVPGDWRHLEVDGSPIFIRRLTKPQIEAAHAGAAADGAGQPPEEDEWVVVSGLCTHAGCRVVAGLGAYEGWVCFCHGSEYDTYGHVRRGPAQHDLPMVPHVIRAGRLILLAGTAR
jgi:ubiquinol-cytochrome c reductase iron-sulfur subunit